MWNRIMRRAGIPAALAAATLLGGCVYPGYYGSYGYPAYAYAGPPVLGGVVIGGYGGYGWHHGWGRWR